MKKSILCAAILISGSWAIFSSQQGDSNSYHILKPLTTVLIVGMALFSMTSENKIYSHYLITALCFCLLGDIFLLNELYFLFGLSAFLIAHMVFTYAFSMVYGFYKKVSPLIILFLVCGSYFLYLKPGLKSYTLPVAIYMTAIIIMTWQAVGLFIRNRQRAYLLIAIGGVLFTLSDALLAYNKFKQPFVLADVLILATYWAAIYLFAYASGFVVLKKLPGNPG